MPTHILLYHATFATVPKDLSRRLHNVAPVELYRQLSWLRRRFRFISIDEWLESRNRRGTAVVTFDDAYKCVFEEALPVLETLGIPATVFINGITLEGKNQWRDKVRYLISHSLVAEFLEWLPEEYANQSAMD
jgi:peptidoglycan/xylan/chitin deacetylase (PgdA/CDA1 family)